MAENLESKSVGSVSGTNLAGNVMMNAGNAMTGPNAQPVPMSNAEKAKTRMNAAFSNAYVEDDARYNKLTSFNASHHGKNFERYYAHPKFKNLGFSPWRDNEAFYNQNSSLWDDAFRGVKATGQLMGLAFSETAANWGSLFSMKPNVEAADKMERIMSVGSSSRDGIGAKLINFGVNAGYTLGTVGEIIAEEALLWGVTAGLAASGVGIPAAAGTGAAATARTGYNIARLSKAFKGLSDTFRAAKKIETARDIFNSAKGIGKAADYLLPFQNTRELLTKAGRAGAKWDTLDNMAKVSKGFGSFYKDLVQINAVTSEAKLEGGFAQNDVVNRLYEDFRKQNGRDPNEGEATAIYNQAREAGYLSAQMNSVGIYVSNKILLDRLFKGIPGMGRLDDVARRKVKGNLVYTGNWAKKDGVWEAVSGVKKFGKSGYYKQTFNPKNLAKGSLGYLSANLMEGTQEVYQEAIAKGITDYYVETFNQPSRAGNAEFYAKMKGGLASQFSEQGLETFLSGFLMAGPVTAVQSAFYKGIDYARIGQLKLKDKQFKADPKNAGKPSPYEAQLNQEKEFTGKVVNALNDITADPTKYFSAIERNAKVQADLARLGEQAALDGDTHAAISNRDESLVEHMITLLDAGKFDIFEDQIKSLKSLPKEDLQEAFDQDPTVEGNPVADRMDTVLKRMNQIREVYDAYQNMENPFQLRQDPIGYMAFEQGKHVMMRNDITYNRLGERMTSVYDTFVNDLPFASANLNDFSVLFSVGTTMEMVTLAASQTGMPNYLVAGGMANEIDILGREIENLRGLGTAEDSKKADDLAEKRNSLQSLNRLVQSYTSMYKVTQSPNQTDEQYENNLKSLQESEEILKKAYTDHLMILGKQNNQTVLLPSVEASFQKYADYWKLAVDKSSVANAINFLNDPNNFRSSVERLQNAMTEASRQRSENLEKALAAFKEKFLTNAFFNELFEKHNVFVSPDEAEAFVDSNIIPSEFFDADTMEPVPTDSDKYKEILKLVDKYDEIFFEESGKRLQRPIVQGEGVARLAGYNTETGEAVEQFFGDKDPADKRAIKQLAEEFGFSSVEPLAVDAKKVLEAVIKSKHASKQQKKLAQAMLSFMRPGMMINFKVDHHTNSTYDPVNGVIVDPRYSAEGFITGTVPIEFSILNGLMQQIVSDSLSDMEFNSRVTEIREQLIAELPEIDRAYFAYALEDNQQFVADVMTNPDLQQAMTKIEYAGDLTAQTPEARTLWQTFMDAVVEMLSKIFPGRTKTLYQEAVNVITNKLVQPPTADAPVLNEELTEEEEPDIPVTGTLDPELETRLKTKFDEIMAAMPEADRNAISYESWKMSDYTALSIINAYNAEQIKKKAGEKELGKGVALTEAEKKRRITALGYTVSELNQMSAEQVNNIIQNNLKKRIKTLLPDQGKLVEKEIPFDQYLRFQDYIEEVISDAVIKLNAKTFDLTNEGYIEVDALGQPIPGTLHKRVSNVVKDKFDGSKEATDRGTIIDNLLRDFISNEIGDINAFKERYNTYKAKYSNAGAFSDQMLDDLFDKFRTINIILKERGIKIISNIPTLYGKLGNEQVAGTIDLFAYDRTGKVYIIDLKTSSQDRRLQYKLEEKLESLFGKQYNEVKALIKASENDINLALDRSTGETKEKLRQIADNPEFAPLITNKGKMPVYFYKEQDALQQNAYKELFKQVTGIEVDGIIIFPIKTAKTGKVYTKADFQKEGNKHTMNVRTFDIHAVLGLENTVESYPENPLSPENKNQFLGTPLPGETKSGKGATGEQQKIPFNGIETTTFDIPGVTMEGFTIDGNYYNVLSHYGRAKVLVNINGVVVPFYLTSGSGGKGLVPGWYPFGGIGQDGWLNKTGKADMESYYSRLIGQENADLLKAVAAKLNEQYGTDAEVFKTPDADPTTTQKPITSLADKTEDYINSKLPFKPTSNKTAETLTNFESNMKQLGDAITKAKGAAPVPTDARADIERKRQETINSIVETYDKGTDLSIGRTTITKIDGTKESISDLKDVFTTGDPFQRLKDSINAKYDAEYVDAVKKGTMTKEQAMKALEEVGRKDSSAYAELAALEGKPAEGVGTQTQLGFEEFTLNVGDRVKINTPKDGEGVIKEDRGDKVLLEDGRQVMKKNLTKLDVPETAQIETNVAEKYRGKIIYATPTTESVEMLEGFKGIIYGPTLYIKAVIGDFDNDTLERIKAIQSGEIQADQWIKDNAEKLVKTLETGISAKTDLLTFQGAIMAIIKSTPDQLADPALKSRLKAIMKKAWDNTMVMAQAEAAKGYTVVFDQNTAAERPEIDLALIDNTSVKVKKKDGVLNKSYSDAIAKIPADKKTEMSGKGLLNVLSGKLNENYIIPEDIVNFNEALASSTPRSLKELIVNMETLSKLGLLESLLASQNITLQGARNLVNKRKKELKNRLDITDTVLQVTGPTPIAVEYEMNGKRLPGIVKSNNGIEIEIVPFQPNMTMEDLFKQSEIVKFSSREVPFNVFPVSTQKPVTVDPEVKTQSDAANQQNVNDFANNSEALKQAMESDERTSSEFGNNFLDRIKCIQYDL